MHKLSAFAEITGITFRCHSSNHDVVKMEIIKFFPNQTDMILRQKKSQAISKVQNIIEIDCFIIILFIY